MKRKILITIGRQYGSGGHQIGKMVAAELGISFYDKELIEIASKKSGLGKEFFENADEKTQHSLIGGLLGFRESITNEMYSENYLCNESLFKIQSDVIRELAEEGSCLFVGRCADYVLADKAFCLNIFIHANLDDRVKRVMQNQEMTEEKAKDYIKKMDKQREGYYNYYSNKEWGAAGSYHLCVNSSVSGLEKTAAYIKFFVEQAMMI